MVHTLEKQQSVCGQNRWQQNFIHYQSEVSFMPSFRNMFVHTPTKVTAQHKNFAALFYRKPERQKTFPVVCVILASWDMICTGLLCLPVHDIGDGTGTCFYCLDVGHFGFWWTLILHKLFSFGQCNWWNYVSKTLVLGFISLYCLQPFPLEQFNWFSGKMKFFLSRTCNMNIFTALNTPYLSKGVEAKMPLQVVSKIEIQQQEQERREDQEGANPVNLQNSTPQASNRLQHNRESS